MWIHASGDAGPFTNFSRRACAIRVGLQWCPALHGVLNLCGVTRLEWFNLQLFPARKYSVFRLQHPDFPTKFGDSHPALTQLRLSLMMRLDSSVLPVRLGAGASPTSSEPKMDERGDVGIVNELVRGGVECSSLAPQVQLQLQLHFQVRVTTHERFKEKKAGFKTWARGGEGGRGDGKGGGELEAFGGARVGVAHTRRRRGEVGRTTAHHWR
ncbi:hypothetical protein B0H11DRAFT_1924293 [Mycena galericulata]|nr:hypothetical protein B0H11DRAFT_1924293 [Mycena galericulata]